jgi:Flp pilus assembly protein TadD
VITSSRCDAGRSAPRNFPATRVSRKRKIPHLQHDASTVSPVGDSARIAFPTALALVGVLAFAVRCFYLIELYGSPLFAVAVGDGWVYVEWARRIAAGQWLPNEPFYQAPLYPYVLGVVFAGLGENLTIVRGLQAFASATSCVLLGLAGREFIGPRTGLLAAGLLALYPWSIFSDGLIQKSSLDLLLVTGLVATLGQLDTSAKSRWAVVSGLVLGLFTLNREAARLVYVVVVAWILWNNTQARSLRTRGQLAVNFTLAFLVVITPIAIHNYRSSGEFILSTWNFGPNFYIGNHPNATGTYVPLQSGRGSAEFEKVDAVALAAAATRRTLTFGEVSDYWLLKSLRFISDEPLAWVRLLGRKLLLTVNAAQLSDTESLAEYSRHSLLLGVLGWITPGLILPLALVGLWITRSNWRRVMVLYGISMALLGSLVLFFVFERYRFPAVAVLLLFAAVALDEFARVARAFRVRLPHPTAAAPTMVLISAVLLAGVAYLPMNKDQADTTLFNVGLGLVKAGRSREAIPVLRDAVSRFPDDAGSHYALGLALDKSGDPDAAIQSFDRAVRLAPEDWQMHSALALTLRDLGRLPDAVPHFSRAAQLKIDDPALHANLAAALAETNRPHEALESFQTALTLDADNLNARVNLAALLVQLGRPREAREHATAAVRLSPAAFEPRYVLGQALALDGLVAEAISSLEEARVRARASGRLDVLPEIDRAIQICRDAMKTR